MGQTRSGSPDENKTATGREKKGKTKADRDRGQEKRVAANEAARRATPRDGKPAATATGPDAGSSKKRGGPPDRAAGTGASRKGTGTGVGRT